MTAEESGTYTDFSLINVGGVKPDGSNAVNELSFLLLDVIEEMRLLQPSSMVQISKKGPDAFLWRALEIIKTGFGQPSVFNTDAIVQELVRQGKSVEDARNGGASGCVEAGAFGKENYTLTGYFNMPKVLELTLHDGFDPRTKKQLGPKTGDPAKFKTFDELFAAFKAQLRHFVDIKIAGNAIIERLYATVLPGPVPLDPDRRLRPQGPGLPRRRRPLQHQLHPGRRPRLDDRHARRRSNTTSSKKRPSR